MILIQRLASCKGPEAALKSSILGPILSKSKIFCTQSCSSQLSGAVTGGESVMNEAINFYTIFDYIAKHDCFMSCVGTVAALAQRKDTWQTLIKSSYQQMITMTSRTGSFRT